MKTKNRVKRKCKMIRTMDKMCKIKITVCRVIKLGNLSCNFEELFIYKLQNYKIPEKERCFKKLRN